MAYQTWLSPVAFQRHHLRASRDINLSSARRTRHPNWSAGIEYNHMFMQDKTYNFVNNGVAFPAGTLAAQSRIRQDVDIITARVNYRFGGPVATQY